MFEIPTSARHRDAIRAAHTERARAFSQLLDAVFHPLRGR